MTRRREAPIFFVRLIPQGSGVATRIDLSDRVIAYAYEDSDTKADKLELTVDNFDLEHFEKPTWKQGAILETSWGYAGNMSPTRTVVIQKVTGFSLLKVEAIAKSILMNKTAKSRTFENMTRTQVVAQVAKENGYGVDVQHIEESVVLYAHIVQARQTDAQFLMALAKKEGFQFFVDFDGLHWHRRKMGQAPLREYVYYNDPQQGDVLSINVENDVTAKPAAVNLKGRDPLAKSNIDITANDKNTARTGLAPVLEVVDPKTGVTTLQANTGMATTAPTTEPSAAAAQRVANGSFIHAQFTAVMMTMKAVGDPRQLSKTVVQVSGVRALSGKYYVSDTKHTIVGAGYDMELKVRRDGKSHPAAATSSAKQNDGKTPAAGTLTPRDVPDPRTGIVTTQYFDSGPRPQGGGGGT